ncbi:hypothetical protein SEA_BOILGATE_30 [Mycobacterium phage Boilgate]|nr:hypothetical protein SEA_BOILGATE_30 [Mycobacterium phage Boilgate]
MTGELAAVLSPLLSLVGVVLAALLGRRAGEATAAAKVRDAETNARAAATADWKAYTDSLNVYNAALAERLGRVEGRLADAEARTAKAEARAAEAEHMYRVAIGYLRQLVEWCSQRLPSGEELPEVPHVLVGDL